MPDMSNWYWTSDYGRDKMLREGIEAQAAIAARNSRSTARLRSQLNQVTGSLERRISALARAFDAYVELGDVREELSNMPSSATVRRQARDAIAILKANGTPPPLAEGQAGHWLATAMNRVITVVRGKVPTPDLEEGPSSTFGPPPAFGTSPSGVGLASPEARIFEALALCLLGHGADIGEQIPSLLTTDGGFTGEQRALFDATLDGHFGEEAIVALGDTIRANLARSESSDWSQWLTREAGSSETKLLRWVEFHTTPVLELEGSTEGANPISVAGYSPIAATEAEQGVDSIAVIEDLVGRIIEEGSPLERDLIHRATVLRRTIEHPDNAAEVPRWEMPSHPVDEIVRESFSRLDPGTTAHRELFSWILPHIEPRIREAMEPMELSESTTSVRTPGGTVEVSADGAVASQERLARQSVEERYARPGWNLPLLIGAIVVMVVAILGCIPAGGLQWWLIPAALASGGLVARAWWLHRPGESDLLRTRALKELDTGLDRAKQRMVASAQRDREFKIERDKLAEVVADRLDQQSTRHNGASDLP